MVEMAGDTDAFEVFRGCGSEIGNVESGDAEDFGAAAEAALVVAFGEEGGDHD